MAGGSRQEELIEDKQQSYEDDEIVMNWVERVEGSGLSPNMPELLSPLPDWIQDRCASSIESEERGTSVGTTLSTAESTEMLSSSQLPDFGAAIESAQKRAGIQVGEGRVMTQVAVSDELRRVMRSAPINVIVGKQHAQMLSEHAKRQTAAPLKGPNTAPEPSDVPVLEPEPTSPKDNPISNNKPKPSPRDAQWKHNSCAASRRSATASPSRTARP